MNLAKAFAQQPRSWILAEMALALLVIGVVDFLTPYQFRLLPLYAGPLFLVGRFLGKRQGLAVALASFVVWWTANWLNGDPELHSWIRTWEIGRHLGFFFLV